MLLLPGKGTPFSVGRSMEERNNALQMFVAAAVLAILSQPHSNPFFLNHTASALAGYDGHSDVSAGYPSGGRHGVVGSSLRLCSKHCGVRQVLASPA
jgi:hypothetical protein